MQLLPRYQNMVAYGRSGFPWSPDLYNGKVRYTKGICPVAEDLQDRTYLGISMCAYESTDQEIDLMVQAFQKVWSNLDLIP